MGLKTNQKKKKLLSCFDYAGGVNCSPRCVLLIAHRFWHYLRDGIHQLFKLFPFFFKLFPWAPPLQIENGQTLIWNLDMRLKYFEAWCFVSHKHVWIANSTALSLNINQYVSWLVDKLKLEYHVCLDVTK